MTDILVTQSLVEAIEDSDASIIRVSQVVVESIGKSSISVIRLSHAVLEVMIPTQSPCPNQEQPEVPYNIMAGIYVLDDSLTHDVLFTSLDPTVEHRKIPDPRYKTAYVGM